MMMNRYAIVIALFALSCVGFGCSKSPEERFFDHMMDFADIVIDNDGDCDKSAQKIIEFTDQNAEQAGLALAEIVTKAAKEKPEAILEKETRRFNRKLTPEQQLILEHPKCEEHEAFAEARKNFGMVMMKPIFDAMAGDVGDVVKE